MFLCHRIFGAVDAVQDHFAEEREPDFACQGIVLLAILRHQEEVIAGLLRRYVDVFADFDRSFCSGVNQSTLKMKVAPLSPISVASP